MIRLYGALLSLGLFAVLRTMEADLLVLAPSADARILSLYPNSNYEKDLISVYTERGNEQRTLTRRSRNQAVAVKQGHGGQDRSFQRFV